MKYKTLSIILSSIAAALLLFTACGGTSSATVSYLYPSQTSSAPAGDLPETPAGEVTLPYIDPNLRTSFTPAGLGFYYDRLTDETERAVYRAVVSALAEFARSTVSVSVPAEFTAQRAGELFDEVLLDYPQFFEATFRYQTVLENGKLSFTMKYQSDSLSQLQAGRGALYAKVNALLAQAAGISDAAQRSLFLYESVMSGAAYDFAELALVGTNFDAHTANGCLVSGKTVCDGYSKAFVLLANYSGIESAVVRGYLNETVYHAWIAVKSGDGWLFCDPTLDDAEQRYAGSDRKPVADPAGGSGKTALPDAVLHVYYSLPYSVMAEDHRFDLSDFGDVAVPAPQDWQQQQNARFDNEAALKSWLKNRLKTAKSGDVLEFGISYEASRGAVTSLIAGLTEDFALSQNGGATNFALYLY